MDGAEIHPRDHAAFLAEIPSLPDDERDALAATLSTYCVGEVAALGVPACERPEIGRLDLETVARLGFAS
ncbi:MAG: hypothetical protein CL908_15755 [Deltaproteobacteria bacterium]|jgi:hypothetical protein|nr:hypothetical protein [Deltaproteobacteria bacterium]